MVLSSIIKEEGNLGNQKVRKNKFYQLISRVNKKYIWKKNSFIKKKEVPKRSKFQHLQMLKKCLKIIKLHFKKTQFCKIQKLKLLKLTNFKYHSNKNYFKNYKKNKLKKTKNSC